MKKILSLFVTLVLVTLVWAQDVQQMPIVPLDSAVRTGVLPNGLTYYIRHNGWPEQRIDFYIAQKVGSMQEEDNQRGLAHFLEHMCFNGTTHFSGSGVKDYLERIGVRFGENLNAYTSFDETVYNINMVNSQTPGAVDSCLMILHDWSHDLSLEDTEIDKERGVINEEWRLRRSAQQRIFEKALPELYPGSKYANRMPIGTMDIVMNFPHENLRQYYRQWYRPDLQGIIIVGDVDIDEIENKIKTVFADIKAPDSTASVREYYTVPDTEGTLVSIQSDKEQTQPVALLMFKRDTAPREMRNTLPYQIQRIMETAVSFMFRQRISDLLQTSQNPPFVNADMSYGAYMVSNTKDCLELDVIMKEGEYMSGLAAAYRELLRVKQFGFTSAEYERFKQEFLSQEENRYNQRDHIGNEEFCTNLSSFFLDNSPCPSIEYEYKMVNEYLPMIPLEAINALAMEELPEGNRAFLMMMPEKEGINIPTKEEILATMAAVEQEKLEGYQEEVNNDPLIPDFQSNGKVKKIADGPYESKLITLSNGIRVYAKKTDFKPNVIVMCARSWGGTSLYGQKDYQNADNSTLVTLGGLGNFSAIQLQKRLSGIQASVGPTISSRWEGLNGSCVTKDFETMMQLLYLNFEPARRDDQAYQNMITRYTSVLENQELDPQTALSDSITSVHYNNDYREVRFKVDDLKNLNYDEILRIAAERFCNPGDFDFFFVGDFDMDTLTTYVARYLGALDTKDCKKENYQPSDLRLTKGERTLIFDKSQDTPNAQVCFTYHTDCEDNLKNEILASMLEQALDMKYLATIREDAGGAYTVQAGASIEDYPEHIATLDIYLPTAPEKVNDMMALIKEGLKEVAENGPTDEQMQKIKEYMQRQHHDSLKENGYWMDALVYKTRYNLELVENYNNTVNGVTKEEIRDFAKRFLDSGNCLIVGMKTPDKK